MGLHRINRNIEHEAAADGVLRNIRNVFDDLLDAETGQRSYFLTGKEHCLAPYTAARARISRDLALLASAPPLDVAFNGDLLKVELLAKRKLAELGHTIELHRRGKVAEALATVNLAMEKRRWMLRVRRSPARRPDLCDRDADRADAAYCIRRAAIMLAIMGMTTALLIIYGWRSMSNAAKENGKLADQLGPA